MQERVNVNESKGINEIRNEIKLRKKRRRKARVWVLFVKRINCDSIEK